MSKLKFDYVKLGKHKRPIIPVRISYNSNATTTLALIDSGADFNLFPIGLAEVLGIKLNRNKPTIFSGVGSENAGMEGYLAIVNLMIFAKGGSMGFDCPVVFTNAIPANGTSLLGEVGFFDMFNEVSLFYNRGKIILQN